jgi:outer membrane protein assembly factor BamB
VDYRNGRVLWSFSGAERQLPFIGSPALSGNRIVTGNRDRFVYCLDRRDGRLLWRRNAGHRVDAAPVADSRNVLVANMRGDLMLLALANGEVVWRYELGSPVTGNPAVSDGLIIAGTLDGTLYALQRRGNR